jgi:hypothetical protein
MESKGLLRRLKLPATLNLAFYVAIPSPPPRFDKVNNMWRRVWKLGSSISCSFLHFPVSSLGCSFTYDRGGKRLWNVGKLVPDCKARYRIGRPSSRWIRLSGARAVSRCRASRADGCLAVPVWRLATRCSHALLPPLFFLSHYVVRAQHFNYLPLPWRAECRSVTRSCPGNSVAGPQEFSLS